MWVRPVRQGRKRGNYGSKVRKGWVRVLIHFTVEKGRTLQITDKDLLAHRMKTYFSKNILSKAIYRKNGCGDRLWFQRDNVHRGKESLVT